MKKKLNFKAGLDYSEKYGSPIMLNIVKSECKQYLNLMYQGKYEVEEVNYDSMKCFYAINVKDMNNGDSLVFYYFKNPVDCQYKNVFTDRVEEDRLDSGLPDKIKLKLEENGFCSVEVNCLSTIFIHGKQKFDDLNKLERFDRVDLDFFSDKEEISKEQFAQVIESLFPVLQSELYCNEQSVVIFQYQFSTYEKDYSLIYKTQMIKEFDSKEEIENKIEEEKLF